jgi:CHAT domain-containing protein/Tfp pilus assembly protein PilF
MKNNYPLLSGTTLKSLILSVFFCLSVSSVFSNVVSKDTVFENEEKAIRLSNVWKLDSIIEAINLFEKTANDLETLGEPQKAVFCFNEAAKLTQIISDYDTAYRVLKKAIKIETTDNLLEEKVISLSLFALISQQKGEAKFSRKYYQEALALSQQTKSPNAKGYALLSAGMYSFFYGNIKETILFFEQADSFAQQTQDFQLICQVLLYIGFSIGRDGNPSNGLKSMQLALRKCEEFNYERGKARSYFGIGFLNMLLNEKQKALDFYKKAEIIFPADFEWIERAMLYNNFGVIYEDYGDLEFAESCRKKAFSFFQRANFPSGQLGTLPSLANLKFLKGEIDEAQKLYNETISMAKTLGESFYVAVANEGLGNLDFYKENYDASIKHFQESLNIYEKIGVKLPRIENSLGLAFKKKGQFILAKKYFNKALRINTQINDLLPATENLYNISKLSLDAGNVEDSIEQLSKAINITETLYADVANSTLKRTYFSNVYERYELYINLLMQKHKQSPNEDFAIQALQASEKSRSRSLLETLRLSEANFTKDANPELVQKEKETRNLLSLKADKLTELLSSNAEKIEIEKVEDEIRTLDNELETIKADLKQQSPIYSAIKNPPPFDIAEFQQNSLDERTVLLEFAFGEKESYLWLIGKTEVSSYVLPTRDVLENRIDKIREVFESRQILPNESNEDYLKRIDNSESIFNAESKLLSNELLGQVVDKIADKRLIIVPDGKLALPFPNSDDNLIAKNEIVCEPSASLLSTLPKIQTHKQLPTKDLLVFADPVFDETDNRLTAKNEDRSILSTVLGLNLRDFRLMDANGKIPRLFATQAEADSIAETVGKSHTEIVSGFSANRERVLNSTISDYRMLHFATHGLVDVNRPEVSSIVLSQFDESGHKTEGFLRLQDIYALDLASDLVVLSACQSGVGKEIKGEGLMSLNNAFLQAGAKSVVSSAWKVDDDATAEFMKRFYANLVDKRFPASQALRQAQIEMSKSAQFSSPFYWAAFTVQGEFRQPISVSRNSFYPVLIGVLGIIGVGLIWRFRKRFFAAD